MDRLTEILRDLESSKSTHDIGLIEVNHYFTTPGGSISVLYKVEYISKYDDKWRMVYPKSTLLSYEDSLSIFRDEKINTLLNENSI